LWQIIDGTNAAIKMAKKHQLQEQHRNDDLVDKIQLIICGDFNGGQECGAIRYLDLSRWSWRGGDMFTI
jgi:hypothetical protein